MSSVKRSAVWDSAMRGEGRGFGGRCKEKWPFGSAKVSVRDRRTSPKGRGSTIFPAPRYLRAIDTSRGIVIRLTKLTDNSWIVHWCTEGEGMIKTVAKGARRPGSVLTVDLFYEAEFSWVRARRGELHALREVAVQEHRLGLRRGYVDTLLAGYFCRLLEQAVEHETPVPEFFDLLRRGLDYLAREGASKKAMIHFERELARLLGVARENGDPADALRAALGDLPAMRRELGERFRDSV